MTLKDGRDGKALDRRRLIVIVQLDVFDHHRMERCILKLQLGLKKQQVRQEAKLGRTYVRDRDEILFQTVHLDFYFKKPTRLVRG